MSGTPTKPLAYGLWIALLVPAALGLAAAVNWLVEALNRERRRRPKKSGLKANSSR